MAKTLYLLNFKNYFNREIEVPGNAIDDYTYAGYSLLNTINNMSLWNPNDGVNTVITTTWFTNTIPNYVIVTPDNSGIIESRWWVIKHERIAGTQYRLYLRRDLIADNLNLVLNGEHSYITRGHCDASTDLIYNKEDITVNQIKTDQIELKDPTYCPWIYIYVKLPGITSRTFDSGDSAFAIDYDALQGARRTIVDNTDSRYWFLWRDYINGAGSQMYKDEPFALSTPKGVPYIVLTVPYGDMYFKKKDGKLVPYTRDQVLTRTQLLVSLFGDFVMDVQVLPYCALTTQQEQGLTPVIDYDVYKSQGMVHLGAYSKPNDPLFGFPQVTQLQWSDIPLHGNFTSEFLQVTDIKKDLIEKTYRLTAPNGNSSWEFNAADLVSSNNEYITFSADMTLLPYQPYLNIKPNFKRLYGRNFKDYRGLNCTGDYSLPRATSEWISYIQNNKNYQASFDRQIESTKLQQKYEKIQEMTNLVTGTISSSASGAASGAIVGGGVGAVVGGVVSGAASLASGIASTVSNDTLRRDELDNMIDQFNMSLDNIKARPTTISGIGAFNVDNTLFPVLEIYDCSVADKVRVDRYLTENNYAINIYGSLKDFLGGSDFYSLIIDRLWYLVTNSDGSVSQVNFVGDSSQLSELVEECRRGFYYLH